MKNEAILLTYFNFEALQKVVHRSAKQHGSIIHIILRAKEPFFDFLYFHDKRQHGYIELRKTTCFSFFTGVTLRNSLGKIEILTKKRITCILSRCDLLLYEEIFKYHDTAVFCPSFDSIHPYTRISFFLLPDFEDQV